MAECSGDPHPGYRIVEILDIDFEEEFVVEVRVQGCDVAALFEVVHVVEKGNALLEERQHAPTTALAFLIRYEKPLTARSILEVVIDDHGSWRPYPQFRSEV